MENNFICPYIQQNKDKKLTKIYQQLKQKNQKIDHQKLNDYLELYNKNNQENENQINEDDEEDFIGNGCPMMSNTKKQDPNLKVEIRQQYNIKYVCKFNEFLKYRSNIEKSMFKKLRDQFDKMPFYLKKTIFDEDKFLIQNRQGDLLSRILFVQKVKEEANKYFNNQNFERALYLYQYCYSTLHYLEVKNYIYDKTFFENPLKKDIFNEISEQNKKYFSVFLDCNIREQRNIDDDSQQDIELYYKVVLQIIVNIGVCCMKIGYFKQAQLCFKESINLFQTKIVKNNQENKEGIEQKHNCFILIRYIQSFLYCSNTSYKQLLELQLYIDLCETYIQKFKAENINIKLSIQNSMGIANYDTVFDQIKLFYIQQLSIKKEEEINLLQDIFYKAKQKFYIQQILQSQQNNKNQQHYSEEYYKQLLKMITNVYLIKIEYYQQKNFAIQSKIIQEMQLYLHVQNRIKKLILLKQDDIITSLLIKELNINLNQNIWDLIITEKLIKIENILNNSHLNELIISEQKNELIKIHQRQFAQKQMDMKKVKGKIQIKDKIKYREISLITTLLIMIIITMWIKK